MTRRECREHLMVMLFQTEFHTKEELPEQISYYMNDIIAPKKDDVAYIQDKFQNVLELLEEIDSLIESVSEGWKLKRMFKVDLAIMRLAVYEMKYDEEIPVSVAINEAVEIAKKYGQDSSPSFVNGILAKVADVIEKG
ncbi:MAG: transcription antitermination factor NusB [Lachnospiraceae bacterium]|nr:transcription antitermination factor NusB [Lachnospiraceae bacterium]